MHLRCIKGKRENLQWVIINFARHKIVSILFGIAALCYARPFNVLFLGSTLQKDKQHPAIEANPHQNNERAQGKLEGMHTIMEQRVRDGLTVHSELSFPLLFHLSKQGG